MKQETNEYINETMRQNYINEIKAFEGKTIKTMIPETIDRWILEFTDGTTASISSVVLASDKSILYLEEMLDVNYSFEE